MQSFSSTDQFVEASERLADWWVTGALGASFGAAGLTLLVLQFDQTAWRCRLKLMGVGGGIS